MNNFESSEKKEIVLPDLPAELLRDQYRNDTFTTSVIPPFCSTTVAQVTEKFNSNPYFLRSSLYVLPTNGYYLEYSKLPFALVATPFSIQGVYTTVSGMDNCTQCRALLSYSSQINNIDKADTGNKYNNYNGQSNNIVSNNNVCCICGHKNTGPLKYPENIGLVSIEQPLYQSSQLPPVFVFVFDSGFAELSEVVDSAAKICATPAFQSLYTHVVFILVDSSDVVFFSAGKYNDNAAININTKDSFNTTNNKHITFKLLRMLGIKPVPELPETIAISSRDSVTISKVCAYIEKVQCVVTDKKLHIATFELLKKLPLLFSGATVAYFLGTTLEPPNHEEFIAATKSVAMNFFLQNRNNLPALSKLAFHTGGRVVSDNYSAAMINIALLHTAYNVTLVLKVSGNIVKRGVVAHDLTENLVCTSLPSMNSSHAATFLLGLEGVSSDKKYAQVIVTSTDCDGVRRVRVLNHIFPTGDGLEVYGGAAFDTIFAVLMKMWVIEAIDVEEYLVRILLFYRNRCARSHSVTQFILPDLLKPLPVLVQAFTKRATVEGSENIAVSMRVEKSSIVLSGVEDVLRLFYPRLFALSDYSGLTQVCSEYNHPLSNTNAIRLKASSISHEEIYVMEDSLNIFVYLGKDLDPLLLQDLCFPMENPMTSKSNIVFSQNPLNSNIIYVNKSEYRIRDNTETGLLLLRAISEINAHYGRVLPIQIIKSGSIEEIKFLSFMIEDKFEYKPSYADFIYKTHIKVHKLLKTNE